VVELKPLFTGRSVIMGVGSPLRKDDGFGPLVIGELRRLGFDKYPLLDAGTTPENYTGKIAALKPDLLLIVDAADFGAEPGRTALFEPEQILLKGFSTHDLSLKTFAAYLKEALPRLRIVVLGVQPLAVGFGEGLSPPVKKALDQVVGEILEV
jgi:hydrogenase 3 maturation protease